MYSSIISIPTTPYTVPSFKISGMEYVNPDGRLDCAALLQQP